jgi:hypothetical protein
VDGRNTAGSVLPSPSKSPDTGMSDKRVQDGDGAARRHLEDRAAAPPHQANRGAV